MRIISLLALIAIFPGVVFAAPRNFAELINYLLSFVNALIPVVAGMALLVFFWGGARFILNADNEDKQQEGKQFLMYGVIGLFVMSSLWGFVNFLADTFIAL